MPDEVPPSAPASLPPATAIEKSLRAANHGLRDRVADLEARFQRLRVQAMDLAAKKDLIIAGLAAELTELRMAVGGHAKRDLEEAERALGQRQQQQKERAEESPE